MRVDSQRYLKTHDCDKSFIPKKLVHKKIKYNICIITLLLPSSEEGLGEVNTENGKTHKRKSEYDCLEVIGR